MKGLATKAGRSLAFFGGILLAASRSRPRLSPARATAHRSLHDGNDFPATGTRHGAAEKEPAPVREGKIPADALVRAVLGQIAFNRAAPSPTDRLFFVTPSRISWFGLPPSIIQETTLPSGPFTSMWNHEWGLIISHFVSVPCSFIGLLTSNSAENA